MFHSVKHIEVKITGVMYVKRGTFKRHLSTIGHTYTQLYPHVLYKR